MATRKPMTLSQLRVGLLALGAIVVLIVFILSVTGDISIFEKTMSVKTRFAAADGLKVGDEVRLAGVRVGQVSEIDFSGDVPDKATDKAIEVQMKINSQEARDRIRQDSKAVLGQQGFLGDRVIDITPGTTAASPVGDGGYIESADTASLAQVFGGANDLLVAFNTVAGQLQQLMAGINRGEGTIGKLLKDDTFITNLNRTVLEAQGLLKRAQEGSGTIAKFLNDPKLYDDIRGLSSELQAVVADLRAGKGTAGKLLTDEQLYSKTNDAMTKINDAIAKFDRIAGEIEAGRGTLGKFVKDEQLHNEVQATVASLRSISERLDRGEGTAGKLLHDDKLYTNANQVSTEIVKMLYDFRQNPRKYLSIKVSLF